MPPDVKYVNGIVRPKVWRSSFTLKFISGNWLVRLIDKVLVF